MYRIYLLVENLTQTMKYTGSECLYLNHYSLHFFLSRKCLVFVIVPLLKKEVEDFKMLWNSHTMRYNKKACTPHGIPDDLYSIPSDSGISLSNT